MARDPNYNRERASATLERDAALGRIARTRRWLLVAAAALTAGLAALASALLPGKSLGANHHAKLATSRSVARGSGPTTPRLPAPASAAALGLRSDESNSAGSSGSGEGNSGAGNSGGGNSGAGNTGAGNSGAGNSGSQAAAPAPQPAPAPAPSGNSGNSGGGVTSGGS